jgi:ABC-type uncharacterized transport system involved in gliding motility auxiliary subunit
VGLLTYVFMAPDAIRNFVGGRQARYGSNALIKGIAFLGILLAVNILAFQNPDFLDSPWDMTEDRSNTMANETLQALESLPEKVMATAFYTPDLDRTSAEKLLSNFKANSNGNFDYKFVDPDRDPLAARAAGITGNGKILLTMGEKQEIAANASETELVRTLIRLINPEERVLYFLEGHGEAALEPAGQDQIAFSVASQTFESKSYTVNTLNLLATDEIPADARAVIIAGPQKPLTSDEVELLKKYVDGGGSLVVMEDPTIGTEFGDSADPLASYLERDWGITLNNDVIFDLATQEALNAVSTYFGPHPITENFSENYSVIMPQARSITVAEPAPEGVTVTPLILTSENSWGETGLDAESTEQFQYDEGLDTLGPLVMAAAGEDSASGGRVVVFGNSLFASDQIFDVYGNGNMFVNSVDWAAEQENLINITPNEPITRSMKVVSGWRYLFIILFAILILPGLILFLGIYSWFDRRRKG